MPRSDKPAWRRQLIIIHAALALAGLQMIVRPSVALLSALAVTPIQRVNILPMIAADILKMEAAVIQVVLMTLLAVALVPGDQVLLIFMQVLLTTMTMAAAPVVPQRLVVPQQLVALTFTCSRRIFKSPFAAPTETWAIRCNAQLRFWRQLQYAPFKASPSFQSQSFSFG